MRFDTSMDSLNVTRSESVTDLNSEVNGLPHPRRASIGHARNDENFIAAPPKPFGIGKHVLRSVSIKIRIIKIHRSIDTHMFYDFLILCMCMHWK